ncbi:DUF4276 family protein [uncultured Gimesia sp.]|uniref:DUF4276 family protein n=1 Tax=uncultured Gimesia sp. TaxID=1678688 RepID=UPI00261CB2C9|nr:DUF4276 family protein [uncultured Gimesia sp.]
MRIAILVEGKTEQAFKPYLQNFLKKRLSGNMPKLDMVPSDGGLKTNDKLQRMVKMLLNDKQHPADAVIALTDVYPDYTTADDAKTKMKKWVGEEEHFYVHVALHDFEAWLLPYWEKIKSLAGSNRKAPANNPETVNHSKSPAYWLAEVYRTGSKKKSYVKARDVGSILKGEDLMVSINACTELKSFINRILSLCGIEEKDLIP